MGADASVPQVMDMAPPPQPGCCCLGPPAPIYFYGRHHCGQMFCLGPGGGDRPRHGHDSGSPDAGYGPHTPARTFCWRGVAAPPRPDAERPRRPRFRRDVSEDRPTLETVSTAVA